jgi:hypothetical protein
MLDGSQKTLPPRHQVHKVSPRKQDINLVFLGELGALVVRTFSLTDYLTLMNPR